MNLNTHGEAFLNSDFTRSTTMPMSKAFEERLFPRLPEIVKYFGTPFHIFDEKGIIETGEGLKQTFREIAGFQEFYAVKALPTPAILKIMGKMGFGLIAVHRN
jgi:diaminopimelate decarboxylase